MLRFASFFVVSLAFFPTTTDAKDPLKDLPPPIAAFADGLDQECRSSGYGQLTANDNFTLKSKHPRDLNGDGATDYIVYRCMFGCSENPKAFTGLSNTCSSGTLLLSNADGHEPIFIPGKVNRAQPGEALRVALTLPRALRIGDNYCKSPYPDYDTQSVYELKEGRFQLVGECPWDGCQSLLGNTSAQYEP